MFNPSTGNAWDQSYVNIVMVSCILFHLLVDINFHRFCEIHFSRIDVFIMFHEQWLSQYNFLSGFLLWWKSNFVDWLNHVCCTWKKVLTLSVSFENIKSLVQNQSWPLDVFRQGPSRGSHWLLLTQHVRHRVTDLTICTSWLGKD